MSTGDAEAVAPSDAAARGQRAAGGRPEVSILVLQPGSDPAAFERCLSSCIAALDGLAGEVIVAASPVRDDALSAAHRHPVRVVQPARRGDGGRGAIAQLAFQHSAGEYVCVVDGDMELSAAFLREALDRLRHDPAAAGVAGRVDEAPRDPYAAPGRSRGPRRAVRRAGQAGSPGTVALYRREAIERAGRYLAHPSLHAHAALELALRLRAAGYDITASTTTAVRRSPPRHAPCAQLRLRWRTRQAYGSGELIRSAVGKPYFWRALGHAPLLFVAWSWWLVLAAAAVAAAWSPWPLVGVSAASALVVMGAIVLEGDIPAGVCSVLGWHVEAAGALIGWFGFRAAAPARPIPRAEAVGGGAMPAATDDAGTGTRQPRDAQSSGDPYGRESVRRGLMHFMKGRIYSGAVQIGLVALYVRHMTIGDYAIYTTLQALVALASGLTTVGLNRAALRYLPEARLAGAVAGLRHLIRTLTLVRLGLVSTAVVAIVLASGPLMALFKLGDDPAVVWAACLYLLANSTTRYQRLTMQSLMLQRELTAGMVHSMNLRLLVAVALIVHFGTFNAFWALAAAAATELFQAALQLRFYSVHLRQLASSAGRRDDAWWPDWREIRRTSLVNAYAAILRQASSGYTLRLIAATYLPPAAVSAFGFFQSLSQRLRPYLPVFLARTLIEPVAMAHYLRDGDFAKLNRVVSVAFKLNLLVIAPLAAWLALCGGPAIAAFTGGKFIEFMWIALLILVSLVSVSHLALLELVANAVNRTALLARGATIAAAATLAYLVGTQPWAGALGLVLTTLLTTSIGNVFVVRSLRGAGFGYRVDLAGVLRIALAAAVAGALAYGLMRLLGQSETKFGSLAALLVTFAAFAGACLLARPFQGDEWSIVLRILPRPIQRRLKGRQ